MIFYKDNIAIHFWLEQYSTACQFLVCLDLQQVSESQSRELWSQVDPEVQLLHSTDESVDQLHTAGLHTHTHISEMTWRQQPVSGVSCASVLPWAWWSFYACRTAGAGTSRSPALQPAQWCTPELAHDWNTHTVHHLTLLTWLGGSLKA